MLQLKIVVGQLVNFSIRETNGIETDYNVIFFFLSSSLLSMQSLRPQLRLY